jgi:hypothetical protein
VAGVVIRFAVVTNGWPGSPCRVVELRKVLPRV